MKNELPGRAFMEAFLARRRELLPKVAPAVEIDKPTRADLEADLKPFDIPLNALQDALLRIKI